MAPRALLSLLLFSPFSAVDAFASTSHSPAKSVLNIKSRPPLGQQHDNDIVTFSRCSTTLAMSSKNEIEGTDRFVACLPYLLPLMDGDRYGKIYLCRPATPWRGGLAPPRPLQTPLLHDSIWTIPGLSWVFLFIQKSQHSQRNSIQYSTSADFGYCLDFSVLVGTTALCHAEGVGRIGIQFCLLCPGGSCGIFTLFQPHWKTPESNSSHLGSQRNANLLKQQDCVLCFFCRDQFLIMEQEVEVNAYIGQSSTKEPIRDLLEMQTSHSNLKNI